MSPQISVTSPLRADLASLKRIGSAFICGGSLWIIHYVFQLLMGLIDGQISMQSRFSLPDCLCFAGAIIGICLGLLLLGNNLRNRASGFATVGQVFAALAAIGAITGLVRFVFFSEPPGVWGGVGVIGSCLGATFIAIAAKRANALPARFSTLLLVIGLATFPLILAFIWPGQYVPAYLTDELPFAISGAAYLVFGRSLQKT